MRVMQIVETPKGLALEASERPVPKPGPGELLIRVRAAGVEFQRVGCEDYPPGHAETTRRQARPPEGAGIVSLHR